MEQKTKKVPGRNGFVYRPQYGVVVVCADEAELQQTYAVLKQQGYKLKVVTV